MESSSLWIWTAESNLRYDWFMRNSIKWLSAQSNWSISDIFSSTSDRELFAAQLFATVKIEGELRKLWSTTNTLDAMMDEFLKNKFKNLYFCKYQRRNFFLCRFSPRRLNDNAILFRCFCFGKLFAQLPNSNSGLTFAIVYRIKSRSVLIPTKPIFAEFDINFGTMMPHIYCFRLVSRYWNARGCWWEKWLNWVHARKWTRLE